MTTTTNAYPAPSHRQLEGDEQQARAAGIRTRAKRPWKRWLRDIALAHAIFALFVLGAGLYFTERYEIMSGSMAPTLEVGETIWAVRLMEPPARGDIVAFVNPTDPEGGDIVLKRVIALPGESVEAVDGVIHVNLGALDESVWTETPEPTEDFGVVQLGEGEYFVMGDNRDESFDSRQFGAVDLEDMEYKVWDR